MPLTLPKLALFVASLAILLPSAAVAQSASDRIAAEIARVKRSLATPPINRPDLVPLASSASQNLMEASAALNSGKLYLSLEKLLLA